MRVYENEPPGQLKRRLWSSVELGTYRAQIALLLAGVALFLLIFRLVPGNQYVQPELNQAVAISLSVIFLPVLGFFVYRILRVFRKWQHYRFYQVNLSSLHRSLWVETSYFTVVLDDGQEGKRVVNTRAIFTTHNLATPLLEDYVNRQAVVGYNEETGQVVFLG